MSVLDHSLWTIFQKKRKKISKYCDLPPAKKQNKRPRGLDTLLELKTQYTKMF